MRKNNLKSILFAGLLGVSPILFSQNVAINNSGNSAYVSAILDLSNNNTPGTVGFLPPYVTFALPLTNFQISGTAAQSNGIIVYNTGGVDPAGLYYWNNAGNTWVPMGGGTVGGAGILNYLARWTPNGTTLGTGVTQDNGITAAMNTTATPPVATQMLTVTGNSTAINAIIGTTIQTGGTGVEGSVINSGGAGGYGVQGLISGTGGGFQYGVYGVSTVTGGNGYGVYGAATGVGSTINYGGYFMASGATNNYGVVVPAGGGNSGFGTNAPVSTLDDAGTFGTGTFNFTTGVGGGNYSLTALANASTYVATPPPIAQTYTLTLPSPAANPRQIYTIVYYGSGAGTIALVPAANTIYQNGIAINPCPLTGGSIVLQSDGNNYQVLTNNGVSAANNGLSTVGNTVQLGGNNLIHASNIPLNGNNLSIQGSSETTNFTTTGQVGIGNAAPNPKAVLDLSNATNYGLMLPGMTTVNLPPIGPPQNGLVVFNTTIGCPEYAYNGVWIAIGAAHGTANFTYSGAVQAFTIPNCDLSITITAVGAAGGTSDLFNGGNGAAVTQIFAVTPGHTLFVEVGNFTVGNDYAGGGGGASYVWDGASTNYPMIAAGGGGGGGFTSNGANASTTLVPTVSVGGCGAGGAGGNAGAGGTVAAKGPGGGGGGWNTAVALPAVATANSGQGGFGEPSNFTGGNSATSDPPFSQGGFGGGGGGGYDNNSTWGGGGGGGGYNGGGGGNSPNNGNQYGGGGGGSGYYNGAFPYTNGANFVNPTTVTVGNTGAGSVSISY